MLPLRLCATCLRGLPWLGAPLSHPYHFSLRLLSSASPSRSPAAPPHSSGGPSGAPKDIPGAPKDPSGAPKNLQGAPKDPSGAPKDPSGAPKDPSGAPREASGAPKDHSEAPKDPAGAPKDPPGAPKDPSGAPKDPAGPPGVGDDEGSPLDEFVEGGPPYRACGVWGPQEIDYEASNRVCISSWGLFVRGLNPLYEGRQKMYKELTSKGIDVEQMQKGEVTNLTKMIMQREVYGDRFPRLPHTLSFEDIIQQLREKYPLKNKK